MVLRGTPGSFIFVYVFKFEAVLDETDNILVANYASLLQSGKLVTKMFQKIQQLIDDKDALVFVLIDEVKISF